MIRLAASRRAGDFMAAAAAAAGAEALASRVRSSWFTSCSQTIWPTSSASAPLSRCLRQMDQISVAYRSTSASQACLSPFPARVTRSVTIGS